MADRTRLLAVALLVGLTLTTAPVSAAPAPEKSSRVADPPTRTIDPGHLRRGRDATIDYLQDGVIHTADGQALSVPTPANDDQRQLLGESRKGWLVAVREGDVGRVVAIRPDRAPKVLRHTRTTSSEGYQSIGWLLARDGRMLVSTTFDRGGSTRVAQTLHGKRLGVEYTGTFLTPMDADAGHVATYAENKFYRLRVFDWVPRTSRTEIARDASYVSLRDDLMFVRTSGRLYGPTAFSAPGTPPWAEAINPLAVSPDGQTVAGLRIAGSGFNSPAILDIRRMDDGTLLDSIRFGKKITMENWSITSAHEQTVRWETSRRLVFQLGSPQGAVLVRCRLEGRCERASDYGGNISTPYETFMW